MKKNLDIKEKKLGRRDGLYSKCRCGHYWKISAAKRLFVFQRFKPHYHIQNMLVRPSNAGNKS